MRLTNIDCEIDLSDVLSELDINRVLDKIDFSGVDISSNNDSVIDDVLNMVKDKLEDESAYNLHNIELSGDIHLSRSDIKGIDSDELIDAIEDIGYTVMTSNDLDNEPMSGAPQNLFEELCNQFDLPRAATTKQDLIKHINSLL